ncbi:hypothetical protein C8R43DRAFT_1023705 [Mycena crocata]|nr:hypothetical protein C8R43DRAFT_1023705 [Mycena crocata]
MSFGRRHHIASRSKNMVVLLRGQSRSSDVHNDPKPPSKPIDNQYRRNEGVVLLTDVTTTMVYEPDPSTATILRASQVTIQPGYTTSMASPATRTHISDREIAFVITAALFGMGVLTLGVAIAHLMRRRWRRKLTRSQDQERGLAEPRDFDDSTWGTSIDGKRHAFREYAPEPPEQPTPASMTPRLSHLDLTLASEGGPTPRTELTTILEQFEQRLHQEEADIAMALHIAFGDTQHCAPFFAGSHDEVTTIMSLQAGMESVGKRAGGIRNRTRGGSDASASSQSTTVTIEAFSSHSSSISSLTSIESMMTDIEESAEEGEEEEVYEVKRAQTHSMEIQRGKLITWHPGGVRLLVTGPSTGTLGTASSDSLSVDLDEFPLPPVA